jgi:hypothetical protein
MRIVVIFLAIAAIGLGCYDIANPYRVGMFGFDSTTANNGDQVLTSIYPDSPAERAGLRPGDVWLLNMPPRATLDANFKRAGQTVVLPILQHGSLTQVKLVSAEYKSLKPLEEGPLTLFMLIVFAFAGVLVAIRGARRGDVALLALFFSGYSLSMALLWFTDVAPLSSVAFAGTVLLQLASLCVNYFLLLFIAHFPPVVSRLRTWIKRIALPLIVLVGLTNAWTDLTSFAARDQLFQIAGSVAPAWFANLAWALVSVILLAGAIEGLLRVGEEHRAQARWVGGAVMLSQAAWLVTNFTLLANPNPQAWSSWMSLFQDVPLLAIAYAILRHRLVDVSIVFSRAAVFGFVSITLVALFVAGEWVAAQILERGLGTTAANGWLGKAVPLAVALLVGLSARSIHATVDRQLNAVFFGKRAQALAALRRLALEADVVTDTNSLMTLTFESVRENIEGKYTAVYIADNGSYGCVRSSHETLPGRLEQNDAALVRLRRWNEPFEMEFGAHPLSEALLLPMSIRGSLLGLLVCGPKRERTHYLTEEIDALALVAHRVGTAYELLSREKPAAIGGDVDISLLRELIRAELQSLDPQPT